MPGNLINPLIVEGQIHGGLAQGIGQAMIEEVVYNEDGQLLTGSFMDYAMPRATDFPRFELDATVTPTPVQPARRQRRRRSRHARLDAEHRQRRGRRAERVRREAHRHDAAARKAVAHHSRPGQEGGRDPDAIRLQPRHVARRCAGEAARGQRRGKFIAGGHSLVPLMKLRLSEPKVLIDIARIPGLSGIREKDGKIEIGAGTVHHDVASSALLREACPVDRRGAPARSAIRRCATAARSAAASRTPIRRPTIPR